MTIKFHWPVVLTSLFAFLQEADATTTYWAVHHGGIATNQSYWGKPALWVHYWWDVPIKMTTALISCLLLMWISRRFPVVQKPLIIALTCIVIFMVLVVTNNCFVIAQIKNY